MSSEVQENRGVDLDERVAAKARPVNSKSGIHSTVHTYDISITDKNDNDESEKGLYVIIKNSDPQMKVQFSFLTPDKQMEKVAQILKRRLEKNHDFADYIYTFYGGTSIPVTSPGEIFDLYRREYKSMRS
jgi:hypothetical protein